MQDDAYVQLKKWLSAKAPDLTDDTDLSEGVVMDSLAFVELLVFVEELRGAPIEPKKIDLENFRTPRKIRDTFLTQPLREQA